MKFLHRLATPLCIPLLINGCVGISTQDYPQGWPEISKQQAGDCLDISGFYHPASVDIRNEVKECFYLDRKTKQEYKTAYLSCTSLADALLYSGYCRENRLSNVVTHHTPIKISQNQQRILLTVVGEDGREEQQAIYRDKDYVCTSNKISIIKPPCIPDQSWNIGGGTTKWSRLFYKGKDDSLVYKESTSMVGAIMLPPFVVGEYAKSWARWKMASIDDRKLREKMIYLGKTKEQLRHSIGEPIKKYFCGEEYQYIEMEELPESIRKEYRPGRIIKVETGNLIVSLKIKRYESDKHLVGIDEFGGKEMRIPIHQIKKIWEKRVVKGYDAWEYEKKQNIYGGKFLHFKSKSGLAYRSSNQLPPEQCILIDDR